MNPPPLSPAAIAYLGQIQALYNSVGFKNSTDAKKRELIGNIIYDHIEKMVGEDKAPKLCGMVIDLPNAELYETLASLDSLNKKMQIGLALLNKAENEEKD